MKLRNALLSLAEKKELSEDMACFCFNRLFKGELSPSQAGAFLMGLRVKGETPGEVFSAVKIAMEYAKKIDTNGLGEKTIDTCGTGGDGKMSFNCSTAVALYLADMGYKVVKHGNRAISSKCGSADIIRALNIPIYEEEDEIKKYLEKNNFVFLFAPYFHPAFANIAPIRGELGVPTIFNLIGPLLNPAEPSHQLVGVGDERYMELIAQVLKKKGINRAAVVHGDGFDEITPTGETKVILVHQDQISNFTIKPEDFGIKRCTSDELTCKDRDRAIELMAMVLKGKGPDAIRNMVALNLGMCIFLLEDSMSLKDAILMAKDKVERGITKIKDFGF